MMDAHRRLVALIVVPGSPILRGTGHVLEADLDVAVDGAILGYLKVKTILDGIVPDRIFGEGVGRIKLHLAGSMIGDGRAKLGEVLGEEGIKVRSYNVLRKNRGQAILELRDVAF